MQSLIRNYFILAAGTNGTGKTTQVLSRLVEPYRKNVLILDPMGQEEKWHVFPLHSKQYVFNLMKGQYDFKKKYGFVHPDLFQKIRVEFDENDKEFWDDIFEWSMNSLLIFDDAMYFLGGDSRANSFRKLFIRRRQRNVDIVFIAHGLSEFPPSFFTFATNIFCFWTVDSFERAKNKIPNYEAIAKKIYEVNEIASNGEPYYYDVLVLRKLN